MCGTKRRIYTARSQRAVLDIPRVNQSIAIVIKAIGTIFRDLGINECIGRNAIKIKTI
jgi:hypothetical protein